MPKPRTIEAAKRDLRAGKSPTVAAGEFVKEQMENLKAGKRGVGSRKQAIAIGLSQARAAGVPLKKRKTSAAKEQTRKAMKSAFQAGRKKAAKRA